MRARTICIACIAIASFLIVGPALAQVQPAALELVDASGTVIGPVLEFNGTDPLVPLLVDSHLIMAFATTDYLYDKYDGVVFFASNDCSGQGFAVLQPGIAGEPHAIVTLSNSVYAGPRAATQLVNLNSSLRSGVAGCQAESGSQGGLVPVSFIRDLSPTWQPPFSLRASAVLAPPSVPAVSLTGLGVLALALAVLGFLLLRPA